MSLNQFTWDPEVYVSKRKKNFEVFEETKYQYAWYLSTVFDVTMAEAKTHLDELCGDSDDWFEDPEVLLTEKNHVNDRKFKVRKYSEVIKRVSDNNWMLSPSMMAYDRPEVNRSITGAASKSNKVERYTLKNKMYEAYGNKDEVLGGIYNLLQANCKTRNNAMSGAHSSEYNIMWYPSAHTALTSICRTATSYANANNERFIVGNRHYHSPEVTINNIVAICSTIVDDTREAIEKVITKYNLICPTPKQVMRMISVNTKNYWINNSKMNVIKELVYNLDDTQRAAFMFMGDFYNFRQINPEFVKAFLSGVAFPCEVATVDTLEEADEHFKRLGGDFDTHISTIHSKVKGQFKWKQIRNGEPEKNKAPDHEGYKLVASTVKRINSFIDGHQDFIDVFWKTDNLPPSIHEFPNSLRKSVIGSDTDSTMFTVHDWVKWYQGSDKFTDTSMGVAGAITFLSSQLNIHNLAIMSAQGGVGADRVFDYTMKSEFFFPVMLISSIPKHYLALIAAQEGLVYDNPKLEKKGVGLIKSKVLKGINTAFEHLVTEVINRVMTGREIVVADVVGYVADLENHIRNKLLSGNAEYLEYGRINSKEHNLSGGRPIESTKYLYHLMWNEVFGPKYGMAEEPQYNVYKVNVLGGSKAAIKEMTDGFEDRALAKRMTDFLQRYKKDKLEVIYIPRDIVDEKGIPTELICGGNFNKVVQGIISHFYLILESFGFYVTDSKRAARSFDERYKNVLGKSTIKLPDLD